jgi:hypothetical protein
MLTLCKSTIVSVGLLAGLAASAHAQSVAALPPDGIAPPAQTAHSPVFGSTQSFYPKPGGGAVWKEERFISHRRGPPPVRVPTPASSPNS